jgi:hypothetical protein
MDLCTIRFLKALHFSVPVDKRTASQIQSQAPSSGDETTFSTECRIRPAMRARDDNYGRARGAAGARSQLHENEHDHDEQAVAVQAPQLGVQRVAVLGLLEAVDPLLCGRECDAVAGQAGADRDGDRQEASMAVKS